MHKCPHFSDDAMWSLRTDWEGHRQQEAAVTPDAKSLLVLSLIVQPSQPPSARPGGKAGRLPGSWENDEAEELPEVGAASWASWACSAAQLF